MIGLFFVAFVLTAFFTYIFHGIIFTFVEVACAFQKISIQGRVYRMVKVAVTGMIFTGILYALFTGGMDARHTRDVNAQDQWHIITTRNCTPTYRAQHYRCGDDPCLFIGPDLYCKVEGGV
jgi:hypothetical protein